MNRAFIAPRRLLLLVICQLALLLLGESSALAAGRVEWKSKTLKEREDKSWRVEVSIYLPRPPDVPHVPMKFEFLPTAYYARDMTDGDKLVEHTVPLDNRQSLIESVDVGFLDSGSGKIEARTRFSFKVTRAHGYEAGEYKVTIRDTRNGQLVGTAQTLKFEGENEIIDRRAMVFASKDKKKEKKDDAGEKKDDAAKSEEAGSADKPAEEAGQSDAPVAEEGAPKGGEGEGEGAGDDGPPPIEEKPGGCGCRMPGAPGSAPAGALVLLGAAFALARVRRRRAA